MHKNLVQNICNFIYEKTEGAHTHTQNGCCTSCCWLRLNFKIGNEMKIMILVISSMVNCTESRNWMTRAIFHFQKYTISLHTNSWATSGCLRDGAPFLSKLYDILFGAFYSLSHSGLATVSHYDFTNDIDTHFVVQWMINKTSWFIIWNVWMKWR